VPVLVRLFHYDGTPRAEWVRSFLRETGHLRLDDERALAAFLQEGQTRCFFLFDGLNEVPSGHRERLVGELVRWMKAHPRHPSVLTSRAQDELWRRLRDGGESLPGNRGELYEGSVSRILQRATKRGMDAGIREQVKRQALWL
jgi:hypothetical protein